MRCFAVFIHPLNKIKHISTAIPIRLKLTTFSFIYYLMVRVRLCANVIKYHHEPTVTIKKKLIDIDAIFLFMNSCNCSQCTMDRYNIVQRLLECTWQRKEKKDALFALFVKIYFHSGESIVNKWKSGLFVKKKNLHTLQ